MMGYHLLLHRPRWPETNITRDPRISIAIANDYPQPLMIKGLSMAARAVEVGDQGEIDHATTILLQRYPEYKVMPRPNPAAVPMLRITPEIVSILDYAKGFGHADLVRVTDSDLAEYIESRRHHWAGHRGRVKQRATQPAATTAR